MHDQTKLIEKEKTKKNTHYNKKLIKHHRSQTCMAKLTTKIDDKEQKMTEVSPKIPREIQKIDQDSCKRISRAPTKSIQGWLGDHRSERCMTNMTFQIGEDAAQTTK